MNNNLLHPLYERSFLHKIIFAVGVMISTLSAATGTVSISSETQDADVYVDGEKRAITGKTPITLSLDEGVHEIMVNKILDEDWHEVQRKKVKVKGSEIIPLFFSLDLEKIVKKKNRGEKEHFVKKGDVVIDNNLDLIWQDDKRVIQVKKNWHEAHEYCRSLSLLNSEGWRVPSYDELITIVDFKKYTLAIMPAFEHIVSEYYWTSRTDKKNSRKARGIYFGNGCPNSNLKLDTYYIRCVKTK